MLRDFCGNCRNELVRRLLKKSLEKFVFFFCEGCKMLLALFLYKMASLILTYWKQAKMSLKIKKRELLWFCIKF